MKVRRSLVFLMEFDSQNFYFHQQNVNNIFHLTRHQRLLKHGVQSKFGLSVGSSSFRKPQNSQTMPDPHLLMLGECKLLFIKGKMTLKQKKKKWGQDLGNCQLSLLTSQGRMCVGPGQMWSFSILNRPILLLECPAILGLHSEGIYSLVARPGYIPEANSLPLFPCSGMDPLPLPKLNCPPLISMEDGISKYL